MWPIIISISIIIWQFFFSKLKKEFSEYFLKQSEKMFL